MIRHIITYRLGSVSLRILLLAWLCLMTAGCGIEAGRYSMQVSLGTMKVIIWANRKDGTMPDPANPGSQAMTDRYINYVPARYNEKTELEFSVKPGRNVADFALEGNDASM